MAKFKVGDRVVSVKTGAKGVVDEVYGEEKYAVLFDGAANPDRVEGYQIKVANAATNAVKTGDWVVLKGDPSKTTLVVDEVRASGHFRVTDIPGAWFTEKDVDIVKKAANSAPLASTNAVVQNALNARTARNATKLMTLIPSKDGNKLNDFIHYAYFTADGKWKEGDIPYVRKDMLIKGLEHELEKAKTTMLAISDAIKQAKEI